MRAQKLICAFLSLASMQVTCLYFPMRSINLTLPILSKLPAPLSPILKLRVLPEWKAENIENVAYGVTSETTPGFFILDGDKVSLNEAVIHSAVDLVNFHQTGVVTATLPDGRGSASTTLYLRFTKDPVNCDKTKRNICFWKEASFQVAEAEEPLELARLSSDFYMKLCNNYLLSYNVVKGNDYLEMRKTKEKSWILLTKKKIKRSDSKIVRFAVNCTVTSNKNSETFLQEFNLTVVAREELEMFIDAIYKASSLNVFYQDEVVSRWVINDPRGKKLHLKITLKNDTDNNFNLKCTGKDVIQDSRETSYYECEVIAKRTIHLKSSYTVVAEIEDLALNSDHPNKLYHRSITFEPTGSKLEKLREMPSASAEESFLLHLKYPEYIEISKKSAVGLRVAEPILSSSISPNEGRKKVAASRIKFQMLTPGAFNVTHIGGIIFVSNRHLLREMSYRLKITGVHSNGYKVFSTVEINVTDTKGSPDGSEVCGKFINETLRVSCSEKRSKADCIKTCGVSSGILKKQGGLEIPLTIGCVWRSNENPEKLSKMYETCSPDLTTCPDRFCDSLELMFSKICPQDCTEYVFGSANKENHLPGIASATGVCGCDSRQKCLCSLVNNLNSTGKQTERRKLKQTVNDTILERHREAISAMQASDVDACGPVCYLSIIGGGVIFICGTFTLLLMIYRRKVKKRCLNQGPLKEDIVNINYEEYVERPGDVIRPLTQNTTVKEIPEYYDKKWEFPRYRLTIEETIGEGEFGKVLKARADGICGNTGSTTVAVKTLKDHAKDSELADLISEYQLLKEIDHPNVIHLLGACTKLDGPVYIIIEYAKHGSLRNYLRQHRNVSYEEINGKESSRFRGQTITPKDILSFAWQIAKGMNYLTDMKLVHRDLAARNVLVAEGLICKISDFGLTRDIYEDDTYLKRSKGRVPVKWMALESLADHIYTTKSDVWSYGIVLWELVTTGASPYPGIAGQNLFHLLKSGYRMEKPPNCSAELYQILRSCWQENPSYRPTFKSLVAKFEEMLGEGKNYLDLNPTTVENKTYFSEFLGKEDDEVFPQGPGETREDEFLQVKFEMFDKIEECNKCKKANCSCETGLRYENEKLISKPKYENDGMEDTGYIQPTGQPKPV